MRACLTARRRLLLVAGVCCFAASTGCQRAEPPTAPDRTAAENKVASAEEPTDSTPTDSTPTEVVTESVFVDDANEMAANSDPSPSEAESPESGQADQQLADSDAAASDAADSDTAATETEDEAPADASDAVGQPAAIDQSAESNFNLWVPTSEGPLLIGMSIGIGDQSLDDVFGTVVDQTLQDVRSALDLDDDAALRWDQLVEHVAKNPAVFGQNASQVGQQADDMEKRYDRNKNDRVDGDEWRSFLFRDSNVSTAFRLFGTDAFRYLNRSDSKLFQAIDRNQDRRIDDSEADRAQESMLIALDQNSDECLEFTECRDPIETPMRNNRDPWQSRRPNRQGNVPMDLSGFVNWSNLAYTLGGMVRSPTPLSGFHPVKAIDENSDQVISEQEAASLAALEPAFVVEVRFDPGDPKHPKTRITAAPEIDGALRSLSETAIELDRLSIRLSVSDQTLGPNSIWASQVRGRCAEHPDALFAWLDADRDNRLTSREIHAAPDKINELLQPGKKLRAADFPDSILIQIIRGDAAQDANRFAITAASKPADSRPRWAIVMDANRDGDLSENEFIGPIETFRGLDTNQDRYLDASEIEAIDKASD